MALEIEHKYLVADDSYRHLATSKREIAQAYLATNPECTIRIRIADSNGYITIKGKNRGSVRQEFEYEIPIDDARRIFNTLALPGKIEKTRFIVPYEGFTWEIDEFHGVHEGLTIAEIEIPSPDCQYTIPPFIGENVTGNPRYYNSNLSRIAATLSTLQKK